MNGRALAARLTTHPDQETRAAFSPDGARIAFTAAYEGPLEVYVMPAAGGPPIRTTGLRPSAGERG